MKYGGPGGWKIHSEYRLKMPGNTYGEVDVIYFPDAIGKQFTLFPIGSTTGYVYEIKPLEYVQGYYKSVLKALGQVEWYTYTLNLYRYLQYDYGSEPNKHHNWTNVKWQIGSLPLPKGVEFIPINPVGELAVWYEGNGVILYADSRWANNQTEKLRSLPGWVAKRWAQHADSEDNNLSQGQKEFIIRLNERYSRLPGTEVKKPDTPRIPQPQLEILFGLGYSVTDSGTLLDPNGKPVLVPTNYISCIPLPQNVPVPTWVWEIIVSAIQKLGTNYQPAFKPVN